MNENNDTPLTVTLPVWFLERISQDVENEARGCRISLRSATVRKCDTQRLDYLRTWVDRWEAVESAITTALEEAGV